MRHLSGRLSAVGAGVLLAVVLGAAPAAASGPPSPGPYPKIELQEAGPGSFLCRDADGTVLYDGSAWTLEPLVRGPAFAPVVLYLREAGNVPVMPLDFTVFAYPIWWESPTGSGSIYSAAGRPVAYGPPPTDTAPRVRCSMTFFGYYEFGSYRMTPELVAMLGLPADQVGEVVTFTNEAAATFSIPRYLFPLTAHVTHPTLPTSDRDTYARSWLPRTTCRSVTRVAYDGPAYTLAPLVRGYRWAPMALWLAGDRIITPQWFRSTVTGTWQTVDGSPARNGPLNATMQNRPRGYGGKPTNATSGYDCRWTGSHDTTTRVTPTLATQLGLPHDLVGRRVRLAGSYITHAYTPTWLFPPAQTSR